MTGYGEAVFDIEGVPYRIQLRSVNHKGLDLRFRVPRQMASFEPEIAVFLRERLNRGHLDVSIDAEGTGSQGTQVLVNRALAEGIARELGLLGESLALAGGVTLDLVAAQEGVIEVIEARLSGEEVRANLFEGLSRAVSALLDARRSEGRRLGDDLKDRAVRLGELVDAMESEATTMLDDTKARLRQRLGEVIGERSAEVDWSERRLEQELVLLAERSDIAEELVRLRSHVVQALELLDDDNDDDGDDAPRDGRTRAEPSGKRLGFLVQEMHRETTTIASKSGRLSVTKLCIDARCEVERIREQVMNLE